MSICAAEANRHIAEALKPGITRDELMDHYGKWADSYDKDVKLVRYNGPAIVAREIGALYPTESHDIRILDVAAGTGLLGQHLSELGFTNIDALDASQDMLDKAAQKKIYKNLILEFLGPNRLNIEDNTYDALVGVGLFSEGHMTGDCLQELIRVVKAGGKLVIALRELFLEDPFLRDSLEPTMQSHHDNGLWRWLSRRRVPNYCGEDAGIVYIFQAI